MLSQLVKYFGAANDSFWIDLFQDLKLLLLSQLVEQFSVSAYDSIWSLLFQDLKLLWLSQLIVEQLGFTDGSLEVYLLYCIHLLLLSQMLEQFEAKDHKLWVCFI